MFWGANQIGLMGPDLVRLLRRVRFHLVTFDEAIDKPDNETLRQQNEFGDGQREGAQLTA